MQKQLKDIFQPAGHFWNKGSSRGMFSLPRKPGPNQRGWGTEPEPYLMFKSNRSRARHTAISVPKETPGTEGTAALKYLQDLITHTLFTLREQPEGNQSTVEQCSWRNDHEKLNISTYFWGRKAITSDLHLVWEFRTSLFSLKTVCQHTCHSVLSRPS